MLERPFLNTFDAQVYSSYEVISSPYWAHITTLRAFKNPYFDILDLWKKPIFSMMECEALSLQKS